MLFGGNSIAQCEIPLTYVTPSKAILESLTKMANSKEDWKYTFEVLQ